MRIAESNIYNQLTGEVEQFLNREPGYWTSVASASVWSSPPTTPATGRTFLRRYCCEPAAAAGRRVNAALPLQASVPPSAASSDASIQARSLHDFTPFRVQMPGIGARSSAPDHAQSPVSNPRTKASESGVPVNGCAKGAGSWSDTIDHGSADLPPLKTEMQSC